jgi:hypothetical protein
MMAGVERRIGDSVESDQETRVLEIIKR